MATLVVAVATLLAACTSTSPAPSPSASSSLPGSPSGSLAGPPSGSPGSPSVSPTHAVAAPGPRVGSCYTLTYEQAQLATASGAGVPCSHTHTAQTFAVGRLDDVVDGHLLAVESERVQRQVASVCPTKLAAFVGGTGDALRLSMLRAVWFTPTDAEAADGARWYRCDVIAIGGPSRLAPLRGSMNGVLSGPHAGDFAMCGTTKPGAGGFARVTCSAKHTWKAISVVPLPAGPYPGRQTVEGAGTAPCRQAAQNLAADALNFQWGYDWPSAAQWAAGQTYGICWAPS